MKNMRKATINLLLSLFVVCVIPALCFAQGKSVDVISIEKDSAMLTVICKIINMFTGPIGQGVVIVVIIISGVSMFFGKMTWVMTAIIIIGVGVVFGAENIVNDILGGTMNCKHYGTMSIVSR